MLGVSLYYQKFKLYINDFYDKLNYKSFIGIETIIYKDWFDLID